MPEPTAPMKTSDFAGFIKPHEASPIFDDASKVSVFQQLIRKVPLAASGEEVPVITSKPTAHWTAEGARKKGTNMGLGLIPMKPQKLTAITVLSAETVRANPGNINGLLRPALAEAFAVAFDYAVAFGLGGDGTGTGPFPKHLSQATKAVQVGTTAKADGGIHGDLVAALRLMNADDKKKITGWALDSSLESDFWGAVDANGRPLYVDLPIDASAAVLQDGGIDVARPGRLLNRRSAMGDGVGNGTTVGFFGNWSKAAWGAVGGISYRVSTEATVTVNGELTSLWENNLVAVLAEAEYGFVMQDEAHFGKLTVAP